MRISDWSSDVCSSDLPDNIARIAHPKIAPVERRGAIGHQQEKLARSKFGAARPPRHRPPCAVAFEVARDDPTVDHDPRAGGAKDRKTVVVGKGAADRVDHGGHRILKNKKKRTK